MKRRIATYDGGFEPTGSAKFLRPKVFQSIIVNAKAKEEGESIFKQVWSIISGAAGDSNRK